MNNDDSKSVIASDDVEMRHPERLRAQRVWPYGVWASLHEALVHATTLRMDYGIQAVVRIPQRGAPQLPSYYDSFTFSVIDAEDEARHHPGSTYGRVPNRHLLNITPSEFPKKTPLRGVVEGGRAA